MIVCHCNVIRCSDIREAVHRLLAEDPSASLRPQSVYKALEKRGRCCGCFPNAEALVGRVLEEALRDMSPATLSEAAAG